MHEIVIQPASTLQPGSDQDEQLIRLWLHGRPPATIVAYRRDVSQCQRFIGRPIGGWTLADLQEWADELGTEVQDTSTRRKLSAVKSLLKFGHRIGVLAFDVGAPLRLPKTRDTLADRILTAQDVERMIRYERNRRNKLILRVFWETGMRVSEVARLSWRDLKRTRDGGLFTVFGKGEKTRWVPVSGELFEDLRKFRGACKPSEPMFRSREGGHVSDDRLRLIVRRAAEQVGIEGNVSPHWIRHTAASEALYNGAPIQVVKATLGHASLASTERYTHVRPGDSISRYLRKSERDEREVGE